MNVKKFFWTAACLMVAMLCPGHCQSIAPTFGTLNFNNNVPTAGIDAPISDANCPANKLVGTNYLAQLYAGTNTTSLVAVGTPVPFGTGTSAGYFNGGTILLGTPGANIFAQVWVWEAASGSTLPTAQRNGSRIGASAILSVVLGGGGAPPGNLVGLQSFRMFVPGAPTITDIPDQTTNEDTSTPAISYTVGNVVGALSEFGSSSNTNLVPNANIVFGGSGNNRTITVTPAPNQFGTVTIVVFVSGDQPSACDSFVLTVNPVNDLPTIGTVKSATTTEDTPTAALPVTVGDVETPAANLVVTASSSDQTVVPNGNITLGGSGANRTVTINPAANANGTVIISLIVTDANGGTGTASFPLSIAPVNDLPTITAISNQSINEDTTTGPLPFTVGDAETAAASLVVVASSSNTTLVPNANVVLGGSGANRTVTIAPAPNQFGSTIISITVSDGLLTVTNSFGLTVISVNDPPVISDIPNQVTTLSTPTAAIPFTISDVETPATSLNLSVTSSDPNVVPTANIVFGGNGNNRTVTVTPRPDQSGTSTITVSVSDGVATVSDSFTVTVVTVNTFPTISDVLDQVTSEDTPTAAIPFTVGDAETPAASLNLSAASSNPILVPVENIVFGGSGSNRTVTITPARDQSGKATITLTVQDGLLSFSDTFVLTVNPVNDAPTISAIAAQTTNEDVPVVITFIVDDTDTPLSSLVLTAKSANVTLIPDSNLVFSGTGTDRALTVTPALNQSGISSITVTVSDGDLSRVTKFAMTVTPVNDLPTISHIVDQKADQDTATPAIPFTIGDVESPLASLVVTASSSNPVLVPNANIAIGGSGANRSITITPVAQQNGTATITLSVTDTDGGVASDNFLLTVSNPALPIITLQPAGQTAPTGGTVTFRARATGDPLTYQWRFNGRDIPGATGTDLVVSNLTFQQGGDYVLRVQNLAGFVLSAPARLRVIVGPSIKESPASQTVSAGANVLMSVAVSGSLPLSFQWRFNGTDLLSETNQTLKLLNVRPDQAGVYQVLVGNDASVATSDSARLTVLTPPTITEQPQSQSVPLGSPATLRVGVAGIGPFTYQWQLNGANLAGANSATLTLPAVFVSNSGRYNVVVANADGATRSNPAALTLQLATLSLADNFASRIRLTAPSGSGLGNNRGATRESGEPAHAGKPGGKSVWVSWIAPANGIAKFETTGSIFDTLLAVYMGSSVNNLTPIASNDDDAAAGSSTSLVTFNATAGAEYHIAVDGFAGAEGTIILSWEFNSTTAQVPIILKGPENQNVVLGVDVNFNVTAVNPPGITAPLTYQWYFNNATIGGAIGSRLTLPKVTTADLGAYLVEVGNGRASVFSSPGELQFNFNETGAADQLISSEDKFASIFGQIAGIQIQPASLGLRPIRRTGAALARGYSGTQIFSTFGSTTEEGEPNHCGVIGGASQWFSYQAESDGTLTISTEGSSFDTVLAVYTGPGTDFASLQQVACDNNGGSDGLDSVVRFAALAGTVYFIAVDGVNGATGNARLSYKLDVPLRFMAVRVDNGDLRLSLNGQAGGNYTLQGSTNMVNWVSILTTNTPTGVISVIDPDAADFDFRYYRAIAGQ